MAFFLLFFSGSIFFSAETLSPSSVRRCKGNYANNLMQFTKDKELQLYGKVLNWTWRAGFFIQCKKVYSGLCQVHHEAATVARLRGEKLPNSTKVNSLLIDQYEAITLYYANLENTLDRLCRQGQLDHYDDPALDHLPQGWNANAQRLYVIQRAVIMRHGLFGGCRARQDAQLMMTHDIQFPDIPDRADAEWYVVELSRTGKEHRDIADGSVQKRDAFIVIGKKAVRDIIYLLENRPSPPEYHIFFRRREPRTDTFFAYKFLISI